MTIPQIQTPEEARRYESAGEFVERTAVQIQAWLNQIGRSGAANGMRWILSATLSSGVKVDIAGLSAHGHSMIRLEGKLHDGTPCLLITHQHCVQLLAYHVPEEPEERPKREIGFHTGIGEDIKIEQ